MAFARFGLHPALLTGVADVGYASPTPIQAAALPVALAGQDVLGLAQTGTGKTAAFALPLLHRLLTDPKSAHIRGLIITPTRELANQIHAAMTALGRHTDIQLLAAYGGMSINRQIEALATGVHVVIGCPGRLLDLSTRETLPLDNVEVLVLDEADRMLDMGFLPDIQALIEWMPAKRQNLMFSATMTKPILKLANTVLKNPKMLELNKSTPAKSVSHAIYEVEESRKTALLLRLLHAAEITSAIVFTGGKKKTERVCRDLILAGHQAASLQGGLSQGRRQRSLDGFRDGSHRILVATDVASRGLDISAISHVINYDMPKCTEDYVHRVGRTGRAAATGIALTFVVPQDSAMIQKVEKLMGAPLPRRKLEGFLTAAEVRAEAAARRQAEDAERRREEEAERAKRRRGALEHTAGPS